MYNMKPKIYTVHILRLIDKKNKHFSFRNFIANGHFLVSNHILHTCMYNALIGVLLQHGKHFHRILKHMQSKQKKLNDPLIPKLTKDQVSTLIQYTIF